MYKKCRAQKSEQRQKMIAVTLLELLQSRDFYSITVTELCSHAEIPRKAFYRYFDSKEDIIRYLVDRVLNRFHERCQELQLNGNPNDLTYNIEMFRFWYSYPDFLRVLTRQECFGMFSRAITSSVVEEEMGFLHSNARRQDRTMAAVFTTAGYCSLLAYWCRHGLRESPEEMGEMMQRLLSEPLYH